MASTTLDYLIPILRVRIGDVASTRYTDAWLLSALNLSIKALERYWDYKYQIDTSNNVTRNINVSFDFDETYGIIQTADEYAIIIMAAIIVLEGSLENSAWGYASWRDNEISYSNLESSRARTGNLNRLWQELDRLLLPPTKRLAVPSKSSLPGYKYNPFENADPEVN